MVSFGRVWKAITGEAAEALRLEPNSAVNSGNVGAVYASLNRLDEAGSIN